MDSTSGGILGDAHEEERIMAYFTIRFMQKLMKASNRSSGKAEEQERKNGCLCWKNVAYTSKYPNHEMDIYLADEDVRAVKPTLFYVHGGGYTWGDKFTDGNKAGFAWYFERFVKAGYNVVSINYAFAPEYHYPTPVLQIGEALCFLREHPEYGISLDEVVFSGSSAGGQLIGQFVNIQTNPAYAELTEIKPVLEREHIKAVIFHSSLLNMERFGEVDTKSGSKLFVQCGEAYFGIPKAWPNDPRIRQANVTEHICDRFPPCYISDGNFNTFTKQARELHERCDALGIRHELHLVPEEEAKLLHGYETIETEYAKKNIEKAIAFLRSI